MKKITGFIRIEIESGKANPSPPVGPALGIRGLNIMQFCKEFNNECKVQLIKEGTPLPTQIIVYEDRTFSFKINTPSLSYLVKQNINIKKGISKPGKEHIYSIDLRHLYEISKIKKYPNTKSLKSICKSLLGSVKSMGITPIIVKK